MEFLRGNETRIKKLFKENNILFAYIFGSFSKGRTGKLSDIDIAIYFKDFLDKEERFNKKLVVQEKLSLIFKRDVDLVILNDAYPLLEHRILKEGKLIFSSDEKKRIDYEVKAIMRYLDFKPFLEQYKKEILNGR